MHALLGADAEDWLLRNGDGTGSLDRLDPDDDPEPGERGMPLRLRSGAPGDLRAYRVLRGDRVTLHLRRDIPLDAVHGLDIVCEGGRPVVRAVRIERWGGGRRVRVARGRGAAG